MIAQHNRTSLIFGIPGLLLHVGGLLAAGYAAEAGHSEFAGFASATGWVGTGLLFVGLAYYAKAKGRSGGWCLAGLTGLFGVLAVACLRDKAKEQNSPKLTLLRFWLWCVGATFAAIVVIAALTALGGEGLIPETPAAGPLYPEKGATSCMERVIDQQPELASRLDAIAAANPDLARDLSLDDLLEAGQKGRFDEVNQLLLENPALLRALVQALIDQNPELSPHAELLEQMFVAYAQDDKAKMVDLYREHPDAVAAGVKVLLAEWPLAAKCAAADGRTLLFSAAWMGNEETVKLLLAQGADANATTLDGWTALHGAASQGHAGVANLLLLAGAEPDARTGDGLPALNMAAAHGHPDVARVLLENGAEANPSNEDGWTLLHAATWHGDATIVELLIAYGANVNAQDKYGRSVLDAAILQGREAIAETLRKAGGKEHFVSTVPDQFEGTSTR